MAVACACCGLPVPALPSAPVAGVWAAAACAVAARVRMEWVVTLDY